MRSLFLAAGFAVLALSGVAAASPVACGQATGAIVTASWYGPGHHGRPTASGEIFDRAALTAAHPCLPFGTVLMVEAVATGQVVAVRINDRGPFLPGRQIDLSEAAARRLGLFRRGLGRVRVYTASIPPVCPAQRACSGDGAALVRR